LPERAAQIKPAVLRLRERRGENQAMKRKSLSSFTQLGQASPHGVRARQSPPPRHQKRIQKSQAEDVEIVVSEVLRADVVVALPLGTQAEKPS
jgi:hypothetical protein